MYWLWHCIHFVFCHPYLWVGTYILFVRPQEFAQIYIVNWCFTCSEVLQKGRECGTGGPGGLGPHLFKTYLVKISKNSKFSRIFFFLFSRAPHKKFASAHPGTTYEKWMKQYTKPTYYIINRNYFEGKISEIEVCVSVQFSDDDEPLLPYPTHGSL